jgi:hypothetical protein
VRQHGRGRPAGTGVSKARREPDYQPGRHGAAIEDALTIPVIYIETSSYDVIQSIGKAASISKNIGIVGFEDLISSYNKIMSIIERNFSVQVSISRISPDTDLPSLLLQMSEDGAEVVIGGHTVATATQHMGLPCVSIETIEETVVDTILQAESFLELRQKERTDRDSEFHHRLRL